MRKSLKASLLSAFVFPGVGHFYLKKYIRATLYTVVCSVCLILLLVEVVELAQIISAQILNGELALDIGRISAKVTEETTRIMHNTDNRALQVLIVFWLISIVDAYWSGWLEEKKARQQAEEIH